MPPSRPGATALRRKSMIPTFTITIGSAGRSSLKAMLDSIARQERISGDQCLVCFDALDRTADELIENMRLVHSYGEGFHATVHVGVAQSEKIIPPCQPYPRGVTIEPGGSYHWLGVEQINHLLQKVNITGSHVFTIGDDDIFVDGAYSLLREVCARNPLRPIIYRFQAPNRWLLWDKPRMKPCYISGCCIAAPTPWVGLHPTDIETTHDYQWMMDILNKAGTEGYEPVWLDYVGVIARPDRLHAHQGIWTCPQNCGRWGYVGEGKLSTCVCGADLWDETVLQPRIVNGVQED